jgi:hypothetical protein
MLGAGPVTTLAVNAVWPNPWLVLFSTRDCRGSYFFGLEVRYALLVLDCHAADRVLLRMQALPHATDWNVGRELSSERNARGKSAFRSRH